MQNKISFAHVPKKLLKRVNAFAEPWEPGETALKEVEVADEVVLEVSHSPGAMAKLSWRRGPWSKSLILALGR